MPHSEEPRKRGRFAHRPSISKAKAIMLECFHFKTSNKIKLNSKFLSKKNVYTSFSCTKDSNVKMDFPAALISGRAAISIKNMQAEILSKTIETEISQICKFFDSSFYKQFASTKVIRNGKALHTPMPMH
jgi:hypothetical protein